MENDGRTLLFWASFILLTLILASATAGHRRPLQNQPPKPALWEIRAWKDSTCDLCGKHMTENPRDGMYIINSHRYWLHGTCEKKMREDVKNAPLVF